jgi:hypothetical protein
MKLFYGLIALFFSAVYVIAQVAGMKNAAALVSSIYGLLVTVFLLALVWAFTKSHLSYIKKVEDVKNTVLEVEGLLECKSKKIV